MSSKGTIIIFGGGGGSGEGGSGVWLYHNKIYLISSPLPS